MISREEFNAIAYAGRQEDPEINIPIERPELPTRFEPAEDHPSAVLNNNEYSDEVHSGNALAGTFAGVGVELGVGFGLSQKLRHGALLRKGLSLARTVKAGSALAVATPEPASTATGALTYAVSEAAIWGVSNLLGQSTRKAFGIQDELSGGELIAASVFGVGVVARGADKIFKLTDGVNDMKAWKDMITTTNGVKTFASGASLGIAETFMRQELENLMNDENNRNAYEYLFAGVLGGSFNSVFAAWSRSGAWGLDQADQLGTNVLKQQDSAINEARELLSKEKNPRKQQSLRKQIRELQRSKEHVESYMAEIGRAKEAQEKLDGRPAQVEELSPEELKAEQQRRAKEMGEEMPEPEDVQLPPTEQPRIPEPEEPTPTPKEEPEVAPTPKEEPEVDVEEGDYTFQGEQVKILETIKKAEQIFKNATGENSSIVLGMLERSLKPHQEELTLLINSRINALIRQSNDGVPLSADTLKALQADVYMLRRLNETVDVIETGGGRIMQAASGQRDLYEEYVTKLSARAYAAQAANIKFQNIVNNLSAGESSLGRELADAFDEYLEIPAKFGLSGRLRFGRDVNVREELKEMDWDEVKSLARDYNENLPEGAERIKLSGKGVTRESVKQRVAETFETKREAGQIQARLRKAVKSVEQRIENLRSVFVDEGSELYDAETGKALKDKYGNDVVDEAGNNAVNSATREALKQDPELIRLNAQAKFYRDAIDEIDKVDALEKELDELLDIEGRGVISEIEQKVLKKYKIDAPKVKTRVDELKAKVKESKARMRKKLSDIEKAQNEMRILDLMKKYEDSLSAALDVVPVSKVTKFFQTANTWRKMNLINQLPSVLAGVPTSIYATLREGIGRPAATAIRAFAKPDISFNLELAGDEFVGFWGAFFSDNGIRETIKRSFRDLRDPTTGHLTKFADDFKGRMTTEGALQRSIRKKTNRVMAEQGLNQMGDQVFNLARITNVFSIGVRGIGALDAVTKRQLTQGTLLGQARREARLKLKKDGETITEERVSELSEEIYKSKWRDDDGLQVIDKLGDHEYFIDEINSALLLARQHMPAEEVHKNIGDQLVKALKNFGDTSPEMEFLVGMFMPYISVPIRGAYKGLALTAGPLPIARAAFANPYTKRLQQRQQEILQNQQAKAVAETQKKMATDPLEIKQLESRINEADAKISQLSARLGAISNAAEQYTQNALIDSLISMSLFFGGYVAATQGLMTGSLNWMTADQREKNKLQPFTGLGMDYRAAAPISIPLAIGADVAHYLTLRRRGLLQEKQNIFWMSAQTMGQLTREVPLFQGFKSLTTIAAGGADAKAKEMTTLAGSYFPMPAQIRKLIQAGAIASGDTRIADLRGATFADRSLYGILGVKPINAKTNHFGEDLVGSATFLSTAVSRQIPKPTLRPETEFEKILATDILGQITNPPSTFIGLKVDQFVNEEGMTLRYAFMQAVKNKKVKLDGARKMTLKEAVEKLISKRSWRRAYEAEFMSKTETRKDYNEGLRQLNALMQKYYNAIEAELAKDDNFLKSFVNNENKTMFEKINAATPRRNLLQNLILGY